MRSVSLIEPLEDRIAPASVTISPNGKTATYQDTAGDTIHVTTTNGKFTAGQFTIASGELSKLSLTGDSAFNGSSIVFSITPVSGGSSSVDVGIIDATGLNLHSVVLPGDLGTITVGDGPTSLALANLSVHSLGAIMATAGESVVTGSIGTINVTGNVEGTLFVQDFPGRVGSGNISLLKIGGSLDGGSTAVAGTLNDSGGSGDIFFTGKLGAAVITGGIEGGSAAYSGVLGGFSSTSGGFGTLSKIGSVSVNGFVPDDPNPGSPGTSILGGSGLGSGGIAAVTVGTVHVAGDVHGGTGTASGVIQAGGALGRVTIGGSLIGGNFTTGNPGEALSSGVVFGASIGSATIGKDLDGGSGINSGQVNSTGLIQSVTIMGDVNGGTAGNSTTSGMAGVIHGQTLGTVVVKGTLNGGSLVTGDANQVASFSGLISSDTSIASVSIGKNVNGASGANSGYILTSSGGVGTLKIGGADTADGSLQGGSGASSGVISVSGTVGTLTLTHSLTGGSGAGSGIISATGGLNSLVIGGSITGGSADNTGTVSVSGLLKNATINGDIQGSSSGATMLSDTGSVQAGGIGTMTVSGALIAGTAGSGGLDTSGAIRSTAAIGSISLGALVGNSTNAAIISAVGQPNLAATAKSDPTIGSITLKGDSSYANASSYADILAGYNADTQNGTVPLGAGVNADAQIGTVTVDGNLTATNIIAGISPATAGFGTAGSAVLSGVGVTDLDSIISTISKIVVTGSVIPTASTTDSYGIAAQYVTSAAIGGVKVSLIPGAHNDTFASSHEHLLSLSGDEFLYEV